ncbi:MAG TPA: MXAN_6640 family putative metalloprotease, partial [Gemmataceae bacterium]|nr:MXAN_6640 family putative metalloprotease [Gemmataceae bacterium]
ADINPANGIPDYVEWVATACENSWSTEIDNLGFTAPMLIGGPDNKYLIQFKHQNSYGYTTGTTAGHTKIVLHPDFIGFPTNDDPEGDQIGALRVTVAHEFKHASQFQTSGWSEGQWVELDATWMEDIVYDNVNDYYHYIFGSGSPFTAPQTSLNPGSYEDCNWEHYQSERLGNGHMLNFWNRRAAFPGEAVLTTYSVNLSNSGLPFTDAWGEYVAWNYACGAHAGSGYGYGEAASYPTTPAASTHTTLPVATTAGSVTNLAANTQLINNTGSLSGTPTFTFTGQAGVSWSVSVLVKDLAGTITRVPMTLSGGAGTLELTGFDYGNLQWAALVIGNATTSGTATYTFSAQSAQSQVGVNDHGAVAGLELGAPVPNPGRGGPMMLRLALPNAARVGATVRDAQGRQVRQLLAAGTRMPAGSNTLVWDGHGEAARALPSGIYFIQAQVDGVRLERSVVLLH